MNTPKILPYLFTGLFAFSCFQSSLFAQGHLDYTFGVKLRYFHDIINRKGGSHFTVSISGGLYRAFTEEVDSETIIIKKWDNIQFIPAYQMSLNLYVNGLGNNMLLQYKKVQLDFVNTFSLTFGNSA